MPLKPMDVEALIDLFMRSTWDELHLEVGGDELLLSHDIQSAGDVQAARPLPTTPPAVATHAGMPADTPSSVSSRARPPDWICVKAPMLGTFYVSPAPDAAPYITVGARVTEETEVCLIEVMKLFTTVRAGVAGIVREIAPKDGDMVEYDQPLLWVEPA